jgi:serine phosphatase RsbU (regulator of sigma subunit)
MSKNTISASATGLPEKLMSPCRVAQLAQDAVAITDAHARADAKQRDSDDQNENNALDIQMRVLTEKLDGIEKAAAVFPATNAIGAMFHLSLIKDAADLIESWVPEESERKNECDEARKAIVRMCYSIRDYIGAITGANPADAGGEYFMSEKYNPHRLIEEAMAQKADDNGQAG